MLGYVKDACDDLNTDGKFAYGFVMVAAGEGEERKMKRTLEHLIIIRKQRRL